MNAQSGEQNNTINDAPAVICCNIITCSVNVVFRFLEKKKNLSMHSAMFHNLANVLKAILPFLTISRETHRCAT